jgi:hypothetical protein
MSRHTLVPFLTLGEGIRVMRTLLAVPVLAALAAMAVVLVQPATSASNKVVASATGGAHSTFADELRTFAVTARDYSDGTTKGEVQINNRDQDRHAHLVIDCLVVSGNTAYMSGTFDHSDDSTLVGLPAALAVRDNGQGAAAPPDEVTLAWPGVTPCTDLGVQAFLDALFFAVEGGNIQVRS